MTDFIDVDGEFSKYEGVGCPYLFEFPNCDFWPTDLRHCCFGGAFLSGAPQDMVFAKFSGGDFPYAQFIESAKQYYLHIRRQDGTCDGCVALRNGLFSPTFNPFLNINILNHRACQLSGNIKFS
jgi:uncharacterized protein YjbI with pentapeptide repeats